MPPPAITVGLFDAVPPLAAPNVNEKGNDSLKNSYGSPVLYAKFAFSTRLNAIAYLFFGNLAQNHPLVTPVWDIEDYLTPITATIGSRFAFSVLSYPPL